MQLIKNSAKCLLSELKVRNFGFKYNNPEEFYRSQWQRGERSVTYLVYRWTWALFFVGLFGACLLLQFAEGKLFIFLTNWGIVLCMATNVLAAILVTRWHYDVGGVRTGAYCSVTKKTNADRLRAAVKLYWLLHYCTLSLALVISTVYWAFLHGKMNKPQRFPMISFVTHCLNSVFMLVDFVVVAFPVRLLHTAYAMLLPIFYCLFTVLYYFCGGTDEYGNHYVYPILDWTKPGRGMTTFAGVFCLYIVYGFVIFLVFKFKRWLQRALSAWTPHAVGLI